MNTRLLIAVTAFSVSLAACSGGGSSPVNTTSVGNAVPATLPVLTPPTGFNTIGLAPGTGLSTNVVGNTSNAGSTNSSTNSEPDTTTDAGSTSGSENSGASGVTSNANIAATTTTNVGTVATTTGNSGSSSSTSAKVKAPY